MNPLSLSHTLFSVVGTHHLHWDLKSEATVEKSCLDQGEESPVFRSLSMILQ